MKKALFATVLMLVVPVAAIAVPPRVATVRVDDILRQLDSSAKANEDYKVKREAISKDKRKVAVDEMSAELELRRGKLADNTNKIDQETRKKLVREFMLKQQELKSLQEDFQSFSAEQQKALNVEMVAGIRERLNLIRGTAEKLAKEDGFDLVFDSSGMSNTGVPLMLYAKTPNDLTDRILTALGPAKPPAAPEPATPASTNKPKKR